MGYDLSKRAKLRCMHLLERRDYTEKQLRDKLRLGKTQYPPEIIDEAIAYVKAYHYVDDARYARQYVECMKVKKSRRQIEQEPTMMQRSGRAEKTPRITCGKIRQLWTRWRQRCASTMVCL